MCGEKANTTGAGLASCCGPFTSEMAEGCPCGGFFKSHRVVCYAFLAVAGLLLLISQVGGILGIVAFVRTL